VAKGGQLAGLAEVTDEALDLARDTFDIRLQGLEGFRIDGALIAGIVQLAAHFAGEAFPVPKKLDELAPMIPLKSLCDGRWN
jgi:hypothetical protein